MPFTIIIARVNHETNTFSPIPTPLEAFGLHGPAWDQDAYRDQKGARTAMGAYLDLAATVPDVAIVTPVSAMANPSGRVSAQAYERMCASILTAVAHGCDAIMLDLHGAMVADGADDGEGELLEKVRRLAPHTPICVALDLHANVTAKMVGNCDIMLSFKTYPHIDMYDTGVHAARLLFDMIGGRARPIVRWRQIPLLSHTMRSSTHDGAMQRAVDAATAAESQPGVLAVSVVAGFGLADFKDAGMSVIVVANDDAALGDAVADCITRRIWDERQGFVYDSEPLAQSLARARDSAAAGGAGPVLLLDHSDNVMSGGTCDTMEVLMAAIEAGMGDIGVGPVCDPEALALLVQAGVGATVRDLALGNKYPRPGDARTQPYRLSGVVRSITDGDFQVTGPIYTGSTVHMGRTAVLDIGAAQIVVTENRVEPYDLGVFTSVGIDPAAKAFLLLKSRMYCRPVFVPISKALIECDSDIGGPTSSNYANFSFARVRRPIYPLDSEVDFEAPR